MVVLDISLRLKRLEGVGRARGQADRRVACSSNGEWRRDSPLSDSDAEQREKGGNDQMTHALASILEHKPAGRLCLFQNTIFRNSLFPSFLGFKVQTRIL